MKKSTAIREIVQVKVGDGIRHTFFNGNCNCIEQSDGTVLEIHADGIICVKTLGFACIREVRPEEVLFVHSEATIRRWHFI